ncbi:MAG: hypothetical protein ACE5GA_01800, partial [Candidatus Zixiibacteriota bacterium]
KSLVIESYADTGKLFSGPFEIYVEANSAYSFLPGGSPVLRATCVPATVGSESGATEKRVTILETTLLEPDRLREFYAEYVSRQVAFVFFDTIFAITTNGGHSWETATLHGGPGDSAGFGGSGLVVHIDGVMIDETGHGFLFASGVENLDSAWVTEDFGITWLPPSF